MVWQYYVVVLGGLGVWYALYRYWRRGIDADLEAGAGVEWERFERQEPALLETLDHQGFAALFAKAEGPRAPLYTLVAVAIFLLGAPFILAITALTIRFMERTGVIPQPAEQAQHIRLTGEGIKLVARADLATLQYILQGWGGFFTFFSLLIFWVLVVYAVMRRYHLRRPGSLRDEILRAR